MQRFEVDGSALIWWNAASNAVEEGLRQDGVVVIDGPNLCHEVTTFQQLADAICGPLSSDNPEHDRMEEDQTSTVNRPTPFSSDRKLLWHNENTFARMWPQRIMFGCQEIGEGGQTPTTDMADVYDRLSESTRSAFAARGVIYVRRLGMDLGLDWRRISTRPQTRPSPRTRAVGREPTGAGTSVGGS